MNTTDTEYAEGTEKLPRDDKAMKDAYNKGETINDIADRYGVDPAEVEAVVVVPVKEPAPLQTQEEIDAKENKGKE